MIKEIIVKEQELQFRELFTIAYEKVEKAPVLLLVLKDDEGRVGLGCAAPDEEVTGESISEVRNVLETKLSRSFFTHKLNDRTWYEEYIRQEFAQYPSAQAAVETAWLHMLALEEGKTMGDYLGQCRQACDLVVTIGIKNLPETLNEASMRVAEGFRAIKLKVGLAVGDDVVKIQEVRRLLPAKIRMVVDANQGYTFEEAKYLLRSISNLDIAAIEQPIRADRQEEFRKLRKLGIMPLIADEMVSNMDKAKMVIEHNYADGINVKMMKFGGLSSCQKIIELALERSKLVMLGCMYESNISITAAANLAMAYPIQLVDLDSGHFDFDNDGTAGGAVVQDGVLHVSGMPRLLKE